MGPLFLLRKIFVRTSESILIICMLDFFFYDFCRLLIIFKINLFEKSFQNTIRAPTSLGQIRPDSKSGLIWLQAVYKGYQQTILAGEDQNEVPLKSDLIISCCFHEWLTYLWKPVNHYSRQNLFTLRLIMSSAENLCKQHGPKSGPTNDRPDLVLNCLTLWWYS